MGEDERYRYYFYYVSDNNTIARLSQSKETENAAINAIQQTKISILESIRSAGYRNTTISEQNGGRYEGTYDELRVLEVHEIASTTTLEELEERPIVINTTDKTDET